MERRGLRPGPVATQKRGDYQVGFGGLQNGANCRLVQENDTRVPRLFFFSPLSSRCFWRVGLIIVRMVDAHMFKCLVWIGLGFVRNTYMICRVMLYEPLTLTSINRLLLSTGNPQESGPISVDSIFVTGQRSYHIHLAKQHARSSFESPFL